MNCFIHYPRNYLWFCMTTFDCRSARYDGRYTDPGKPGPWQANHAKHNRLSPYTPYPIPYTLCPMPYTLYLCPITYTLNHIPYAGKTAEQEQTAKTTEQAAKESEAKASEQAAKENVVKASEKAGKRCPNGFMSVNEMEGTETMWNVKTKTTNGVDIVVRTLDCESFALAPICGPHSINKPEPNMTIALTVQLTLTLIQTSPRCLSWV